MLGTGTDRFGHNTRVSIHVRVSLFESRLIVLHMDLYSLNKTQNRGPSEQWSGEATRNQGFAVEETRVDVNMDGDDAPDAVRAKDRPVWMTESTVVSTSAVLDGTSGGLSAADSADAILQKAAIASTHFVGSTGGRGGRRHDAAEDIMSVLLQHEKQRDKASVSQSAVRGLGGGDYSSDSSDDDNDIDNSAIREYLDNIPFHRISIIVR